MLKEVITFLSQRQRILLLLEWQTMTFMITLVPLPPISRGTYEVTQVDTAHVIGLYFVIAEELQT